MRIRRADLPERLRPRVLRRAHPDDPLRRGPVSDPYPRLHKAPRLVPELTFRRIAARNRLQGRYFLPGWRRIQHLQINGSYLPKQVVRISQKIVPKAHIDGEARADLPVVGEVRSHPA